MTTVNRYVTQDGAVYETGSGIDADGHQYTYRQMINEPPSYLRSEPVEEILPPDYMRSEPVEEILPPDYMRADSSEPMLEEIVPSTELVEEVLPPEELDTSNLPELEEVPLETLDLNGNTSSQTVTNGHVLYGVFNPSPVSPVSPAPGGGTALGLTRAKIEENIATLNSAATTMRDAWNTALNKNLTTIQSSWAGKDCESYVNKVKALDTKMQNSIQSIELLSKTFRNALSIIDERTQTVMNVINNN